MTDRPVPVTEIGSRKALPVSGTTCAGTCDQFQLQASMTAKSALCKTAIISNCYSIQSHFLLTPQIGLSADHCARLFTYLLDFRAHQ